MRCPFCGSHDTKVIDSRPASDGHEIRRRRECLACFARYSTYETASLALPVIIKSNDVRESFDIEKLRSGMQRAVEKRAVSVEKFESAISEITHKAITSGEREIPSKYIGDWALEELGKLDQVAYMRFASVYMSFEDINSFRDLADKLERTLTPEMLESQIPLISEKEDKKK